MASPDMKSLSYSTLVILILFSSAALTSVPPVKRFGYDNNLRCWQKPNRCENLKTATECDAVKYCIVSVWTDQKLPADTSDICTTCKDMVKQARDQLESNQTQEDIKAVFEGSCALLRYPPVVKECKSIADEFIPQLIETLASQMNPQVVCSVSGLCNNARWERFTNDAVATVVNKDEKMCDNCYSVMSIIRHKLDAMSRDDVLQKLQEMCGYTSSFSDSCTSIVITYFSQIYRHLKEHMTAQEVCLLSGDCSGKFHQHKPQEIEITPMSHIGYVDPKSSDDLPCDMCKQLVSHLRELLVASTTKLEFEQVLKGLCGETGSFKSECLKIVEQHYEMIYDFFVHEFSEGAACEFLQICKTNQTIDAHEEIVQPAQLPFELLVPPHMIYDQQVNNGPSCELCQLVLHGIQTQLSEPKTEESIRRDLDRYCNTLPTSITGACIEFVNSNEKILVAELIHEIDPSVLCVKLHLCSSLKYGLSDVEIIPGIRDLQSSGGSCPLCLLAIQQIENAVKDQKSKEKIKEELDRLCIKLPESMQKECEDFVKKYSDTVIEALLSDLNPTEVCVYIKLCNDTTDGQPFNEIDFPLLNRHGDTDTNLIPDDTINGVSVIGIQEQSGKAGPECIICEFVMSKLEHILKNNKSALELEKIVKDICKILPKTVEVDCDKFIEKYGETIITLLTEAASPAAICTMMDLCLANVKPEKHVFGCSVCEMVVDSMSTILSNPNLDNSLVHILEKTCRGVPRSVQGNCQQLIEVYGKRMVDLVKHLADKTLVCKDIRMCDKDSQAITSSTKLLGSNKCLFGPSYWCATRVNAEQCNTIDFCTQRVW